MPRRFGLLSVSVLVAGVAWAGPAQASFPGPDGRIAFGDFNTGQIYSINPDGTSLRQLTHVPSGGFAEQPDWSPDARQIAFDASAPGGEVRLYVMDRDGGRQHVVFSEQPGFSDFQATYTPDGRRLVFTRCQADGVCAIYTVGIDGTRLRPLTRFQSRLDVFDVQPAVSPDGAAIAFTRYNAGGIASQIYLMRSDGSGAHPITPAALEGFAPDWTPDGQHLLVGSSSSRIGGGLYAVNPDGTGLRQLTDPPFPRTDILPSAAPQGDRMVFSSNRLHPDRCCLQLFTAQAHGPGLRLLETGLLGAVAADWGSAPRDHATATPTATTTADPAVTAAGCRLPALGPVCPLTGLPVENPEGATR